MRDDLDEWKMHGHAYVWRYVSDRARHHGWHFTADPAGCNALIELLTVMRQKQNLVYRTIELSCPSSAISSVPGFDDPKADHFAKLRIMFDPYFTDLQMLLVEDRLELRFGTDRCDDLLIALVDVCHGKGDFAFGPNKTKDSPPIWFWWMPWSMGFYS